MSLLVDIKLKYRYKYIYIISTNFDNFVYINFTTY